MAADEAARYRAALIAELERQNVLRDPSVRAAMLSVPRHAFLPNEPLERAYANDAIPTKFADGVSISSASQPAIVAEMLEQLALAPGLRVLEIGAGTGYNAALLRTLVGPGGRVTTVDIDADITDAAREHLAATGITDLEIVTADGAAGYAPNAPYERIILTVNAADIAPAWVEQLAPGGVLVLPLSIGPTQFSIAFEKGGDGILRSRSLQPCGFMPLRGIMGDAATGSRSISPAPGLRLTLTNADVGAAGNFAALVQAVPTTRAIPSVRRGWFTALSFALAAPGQPYVGAFMLSDDARFGFVGHGYGVFDRAGGSGAVLRLADVADGTAELTVLVYGGAQVADWLAALLAQWEQQGAPPPQRYTVTAYPPGAPIVAPPGASVVALPHWQLVIAVGRT